MRRVLLHAARSLSDLDQIPKEDIQTLEQLWLSLTMPQQHLCHAKDTRLDPDFGKNGRVPGGGCGLMGCVGHVYQFFSQCIRIASLSW